MNIEELKEKVNAEKTPRSKWEKAVRGYALEMLDNIEDTTRPADSLNLGELVNHCGYMPVKIGMFSEYAWYAAKETSEGGCFLIYTRDIAENLATPSELKRCTRKDGSLRDPNQRETWLDCQTRAVFQALLMIQRNARGC